ncbi:MAG: glycosyltransferase [Desulfocapsa sp.]|nr:glycosyltransferase [Desulfocapsa sp.]
MGIKCHTEEFKIAAVKQNRINICICTYLRSESLLKCLHSLALIECPANTDVVITVIDNDELGSANKIVTSLIDRFPFALFYHIEPKRGIPCARNRALDEAHKLNCEYLAFIDDDEWVETDWLIRLYGFCRKHGGDVIVSGSVVSELPAATPEHIRGLFNKKEKLTGSQLSSCATNNVLVPT